MLDNPSVDALLIMLVSALALVYIAWYLYRHVGIPRAGQQERWRTVYLPPPEPPVLIPVSAQQGIYYTAQKENFCIECGNPLKHGRCIIDHKEENP